MKKRIFSLLVCLIFCFSCGLTASAEAYKGFTYDFWEEAVPSQIGYTVENVYRADDISKEIGGFSEPKDMFITDEQDIYILDSGNSRVVVLDKEFKLKKIIDRFVYKQEEFSLSNPTGIFVDKNGKMYIADPKSSCVLISDANGVVEAKLEKPSTDMLDEKLEFLPQKVLVDSAGTIYVSATGIYQGALLYKPDGEFDGFYGSNTVDVSAKLLLDRFWKSILTNEQADNIAKYFPEEFTSFDIDERDFVFTVTKTTSTKKKIKKLNPMGRDTLEAEKFGELESVPINGKVTDSVFVDIVVSNSGVFSALDQRSNRVFQYDSEGELLFVFGGNGSQSGTFLTPVAIETMNDKLLVLDSQKNNITVFAPTDFGNMVLEAVSYYIDGKYGEASALWEEILKYDHNYLTAYVSIGKTLMAEEKYEQAAAASMSPLVSTRAFLQSIMPQPVFSLKACTSLAVKAIFISSVYYNLLFSIFGNFFSCLFNSSCAHLITLSAFNNSSSDSFSDKLNCTDSIVVTRDNCINFVRITVSINDSDNRDT